MSGKLDWRSRLVQWWWPIAHPHFKDNASALLVHGVLLLSLLSATIFGLFMVAAERSQPIGLLVLVSSTVLYGVLLALNLKGRTQLAARAYILALFAVVVTISLSEPSSYWRVVQLYMVIIMLTLFTQGVTAAIGVGVVSVVLSGGLMLSPPVSPDTTARVENFLLWVALTLESSFGIYLLVTARHLMLREQRQHQRTAHNLADAQARYQLLFENIPVGLAILDRDGTITLANQALADNWGITSAQLIGHNGSEFAPPTVGQQLDAERSQILAQTAPTRRESKFTRSDGSEQWIETTSVPEPSGQILIVSRDTTAQKTRELALEGRARLLEMVSNAIVESDAEFRITSWNKAAETIFGFTAEEVIGKRYADTIRGDAEGSTIALSRLLADGEWAGVLRQRRKDGTPLVTYSTIRVTYDDAGQVTGFLGVGVDMTAVLALEDERFRNQQMQLLVSQYSRSLRDPLAAMLLDVHMLQTSNDDAIRQASIIGLQHHVDKFERKIRSLLLLTHLDQPNTHYPLPIEPIDLVALLRELHQRHKAFASQQRQFFELENLPPTLLIQGGYLELERALDELIMFSLDRADLGGTIGLGLASDHTRATITLRYDREKPSDRTIKQVMADFSDLSEADAERGRELDLARKIIAMHQGTLAAELRDQQVAFTVTLPVQLRD